MRIGIDLDDVLADTLAQIIEYYNSTYNARLTKDQFRSYGYWHTWGGTKEEAIQILHDFYDTPYFTNVQPIPGAKKALHILKQNNDLFIVTSRPNSIAQQTHVWLNQHFPDTFASVNFGNHYSLDGEPVTKMQICDQLEIDILIEDALEYALECATDKRNVFLLDNPWNQQSELPLGIQRFDAWSDIVTEIG